MKLEKKSPPKKSKVTALGHKINALREEAKTAGFGYRYVERRLSEALEELYLMEHKERSK